MSDPQCPPSPQWLQCPACGSVIDVGSASSSAVSAGFITCPHCRADLLLPDPQQPSSTQTETPQELEPAPITLGGELDALRIQRLAAMRRATYRSRSYALIAAGGCAVAGVQLAVTAVRQLLAAGWGTRAAAYALLAILAGCAAVYFWLRAVQLSAEIRRSISQQPTTPPDFSTLGDGST
ncbi:hypothetical protein [Fontivita pretiosa]|jgi:hypothetical protein|uniref:hypothetical protein n=1 Tax=Fontivita pretiosa TaxID=2989684 RepID=UPI003D16405A